MQTKHLLPGLLLINCLILFSSCEVPPSWLRLTLLLTLLPSPRLIRLRIR